jgi:HEAT repeat protein
MLEITCVKCQTPIRFKARPGLRTVACPSCNQRMRLASSRDDSASSLSLPETPEPPEPDEAPRRSLAGPLLVGFSGLAGLFVASLILVAWFILGRAPANPDTGKLRHLTASAGNKKRTPRPAPAPEAGEGGQSTDDPTKGQSTGKNPGTGGAARTELSSEEIYTRLLRSCAWIVSEDGSAGSGAIVDLDERLVLTNEHVANERSGKVFVLFPARSSAGKLIKDKSHYLGLIKKGVAARGRVVRVDRKRDLALLQVDRLPPGRKALALARRSPNPGQKVYTVGGSPEGNSNMWILTPGMVRQVSFDRWEYDDGFPRAAECIASDAPINRGDSGGGLVNSHGVYIGTNAWYGKGRSNSRHIDVTESLDFLRAHFRSLGKDWSPPAGEEPVHVAQQLPQLQKDLQDASPSVRARAAKELGELGSDARKVVPDLLKLLRDNRQPEEVRTASARALEEIGPPATSDLANLSAALEDSLCVEARRYAARAAGQVGAKASETIPALVAALGDVDTEVRRRAAVALGGIGPPARDKAHAWLVALLSDREATVRPAALAALSRLGKPDSINQAAAQKLIQQRTATVEARAYGILQLLFLGEDSAGAVAAVLTPETDLEIAAAAAAALGALKVKSPVVCQALTRGLDHKSKAVREESVVALVQIGFDAALFPAYLKALSSPEVEVRRVALNHMPLVGTFVKNNPSLNLTRDALATLKPILTHSEPLTRYVAAYALGTLGPEARAVLPDLRAALRKETLREVRMEQLAAMTAMRLADWDQLGDQADGLLSELLDLAKDTRKDQRPAQTCAALAVLSVNGKSKQAPQALLLLARGILRDTPVGVAPRPGFLPGQPGRGSATMPVVGKFSPVEDEVHERAKAALAKGGQPAAKAVASAFKTSFQGNRFDNAISRSDKVLARRTTFDLLALIGQEAACPEVRAILNSTFAQGRKNNEAPEVVRAASEARASIYGK